MRREILAHAASNMRGQAWQWIFYLNRTADNRYTLSCRQVIQGERAQRVSSTRGIRDGAEIFGALSDMAAAVGIDVRHLNLNEIAAKVKLIAPGEEDRFLDGERILEMRAEREQTRLEAQRAGLLGPYRKFIDEFALRFSDAPVRHGPTARAAATKFIEEHVLEHGILPFDTHRMHLTGSASYTGSECDFTELTEAYQRHLDLVHPGVNIIDLPDPLGDDGEIIEFYRELISDRIGPAEYSALIELHELLQFRSEVGMETSKLRRALKAIRYRKVGK